MMNPKRALPNVAMNSGIAGDLTEQQQLKLTEILDTCLDDFESGRPVDHDALIAAHPELAGPLAEYFESLKFLYEASSGIRPHPTETENAAPQNIGEYRILREIGRGGMGVVYEAEDSALLRRVALKVLPFAALLDQKQIARFHNEAQASGQLHHPHIVPVYSVGCDRGVHYFAMQLVDGQPLDVAIGEMRAAQIAAKTKKSSSEEIAPACESTSPWQSISTVGSHRTREYMRIIAVLAANVADGLQHAHEFGILHRDIKPSNLLLDQAGKVWITDFGLAHLPNNESITMTGDVMGTIRYMSPEQAAGRARFTDHRTDIYSLGITLYELATLERAFDMEHRDEFLASIASHEPMAPRRMNDAIPVDLETIIVKAISKAPEERYQTSAEMADDLRRFLAGKPTLAQPPTLLDHAAKWTKRNLRLVTASIVSLAIALAVTGVVAMKLSRAVNTATRQTRLAEERFRIAHDTIDQWMITVEELNLFPGTSRLKNRLLENSLHYYEKFTAENADDANLSLEMGSAIFKAAAISEQLGDRQKARKYYDEACRGFQKLEASNHGLMQRQATLHLAHCFNNRGLLSWREGDSQSALRDLNAALECHKRAQTELDGDSSDAADLASTLVNKAILLAEFGEKAESRELMERSIKLQRRLLAAETDEKKSSRLASSLHHFAAQLASDNPALAEKVCVEAVELQKKLVKEHPNRVMYESDLALGYNSLGALHLRLGNTVTAESAYRNAVRILDRAVMREPDVFAYQRDLAICLNNLGRTELAAGTAADASATLTIAEQQLKKMIRRYDRNPGLESTLGSVEFNQGMTLLGLGEIDEARKKVRFASDHQRSAAELAEDGSPYRAILDDQLRRTSVAFESVNDFEAAFGALRDRCRGTVSAEILLDSVERTDKLVGVAGDAGFSQSRIAAWRNESLDWLGLAFDQGDKLAKFKEMSLPNLSGHSKYKKLKARFDTDSERVHPE